LWTTPTYWSWWWTRIWNGGCPWFMNIKRSTLIPYTLVQVWHGGRHFGTNLSFNECYEKGKKVPSTISK
jgi:hypothetical protein